MPGVLQSGRVILQGQHEIPLCWVSLTIEHFLAWFPLANDFLKNQPIKGADIYYMRMILHNWADSYCLQILKLLREAAAPNSRLLIVESIMSYACEDTTIAKEIPGGTGLVPPELLLPNWGHANVFTYLVNTQVLVSYFTDLGQNLTSVVSTPR